MRAWGSWLAAGIAPIPGHAVFLLFIQLALLLIVARLGAEFTKRIGLPAVIGELAAGIVLGPTIFGHYAPGIFEHVFPQETMQFNLLETVGTLGMVLLLLLTGLETDLKLLRNLGRAALVASLMGMVIPFGLGFGLGMVMPVEYLVSPDHRVLFSLFLATAMSISAMPVIAKILMDLDLTKRNIGLVILSAGVVDDTAGWLILSVIAGAASRGSANVLALGKTIGLMFVFLGAVAFVIYPLLRVLIPVSHRFKSADGELAVVAIVTFLCSAATEEIGVHAVFGAFIIGTAFRQVVTLRHETVHALESFVLAVLAPIFFGVVGLKVNLWLLGSGGGTMLGIVVAVACLGKLVGCTIGGLWGGLRFWEALSIAVAMNARGAMELVVATIGLSLGLLNQTMFSIIVIVAIFTSFLAPVLLRLTMRMVRMTDEEQRRILEEQSKGAFDPIRLKLLVPTAGGPNAMEAMRIAAQIGKKSDNAIEVLYVDAKGKWWQALPFIRRDDPAGRGIEEHLAELKKIVEGAPASSRDGKPVAAAKAGVKVRRVATREASEAIVAEARNGFDVILMGASQRGQMIGGKILQEVVEGAPCHVAIMRAEKDAQKYERLLVPVDGSVASRVAVELAVRYAEASGATLTLALLSETQKTMTPMMRDNVGGTGPYPTQVAPVAATTVTTPGGRTKSIVPLPTPRTPEEELERVSVVFRTSPVKPALRRVSYDPQGNAVSNVAASGEFDLVVVGAENRAIQNRLFFGHDNERLIQRTPVAVMIVVPNIGMLK